ncbi:MAG: dockerin type I domain-containing protein [Xanthomonadales bacterium]|jgi:hypothetical protein|nr:dockerin type I domain-containing protein [Xanthomonadales bacterium]
MSRIKFLSAVVGALAFASSTSVMAQCSIAAWSNAATTTATASTPAGGGRYSGSCAAVVAAPGANSFVVDNTPAAETSYRARFYVYTGNLGGAEADVFQAQNAANANIVRVTYTAGTGFRFYANGANGGNAIGTPVAAVADRWYGVEVRWTNAGTFSAIVRGNATAAPAQPQVSITGFSNSADRIETARLGILTTTGVTGGIRLDDFDSRRTTDIGFIVRGDANNNGSLSIADAIAVRNEANGGALAPGQADCNENGSVNISDAICVRNQL